MLKKHAWTLICTLLLAIFIIGTNGAQAATSYKTTAISKIGVIKSTKAKIYKQPDAKATSKMATKAQTTQVMMSNKKVKTNGVTYYAIHKYGDTKKTQLGWVKSTDIKIRSYSVTSTKSQTFYIKGSGRGYVSPWGSTDYTYKSLKAYKNVKFTATTTIASTSKWYRGKLNGKTVWIHSSYLSTKKGAATLNTAANNSTKPVEKSISYVAKVSSSSAKIYNDVQKTAAYSKAGTKNTNTVLYVKKQSTYKGITYYLLSTQASATSGVVGWIKKSDVTAYKHAAVSTKSKTLSLIGTGSAYTKIWGGTNDISIKSLKSYKNKKIVVTTTEKVGKTDWYKGKIGTKTVWVSSSKTQKAAQTASEPTEKTASFVGLLKSSTVKIYKDVTNLEDFVLANGTYTNETFYIKKEATLDGKEYYQISRTNGTATTVVGWVAKNDVTITSNSLVDTKTFTTYIAGTNTAYNIPNGTTKNVVYDLSKYRAKAFKVIRTEKVGTSIWYQGTLANKTVWINSLYVETNPYIAVNLRKSTDLTAAEMRSFLLSKGKTTDNVLYKLAPTFIEVQNEVGINAQFMLAHAILETGWGGSTISQYKNNYFGYQAYDTCALTCAKYFPTGKDGLNAYAFKIYRDYLTTTGAYYNGATLLGMNVRYATDKEWSRKIANLMTQMKAYKSADYSSKTASTKVMKAPIEYDHILPESKSQPAQFVKLPSDVTASVKASSGLGIYNMPYAFAKKIGTYGKAQVITLKAYHTDVRDFKNNSGKNTRWLRITYNGTQGWVRTDEITLENLSFTKDESNLRSIAGSTDKDTIKEVVPNNAPLKHVYTIFGNKRKKTEGKTTWYQVYGPKTGKELWVSETLLTTF
ncbi:glucosaminidase domain-containing protein [Viridibacillus sp. YIM B01967]|uniref:Glucosaminidase domain-containing protein n=1 Tax=Viridibacillus soli TaxID=2798301 RepID=A0ABS1H846_9BACL|nr:glucosaminidase domain-containing protein [Viridibacillus soli]MBK3495590.1 glucosaminidase domain-containing protein [Viridibacillus soli]